MKKNKAFLKTSMKKAFLIAFVLFSQLAVFAQSEKFIIPYIDMVGRDVCLAWDNETGKSVYYSWSDDTYNWEPYEINIKSNPVSGASGKTMLSPYVDKKGRDVVLAWDTKTGKSVFYRWNSSSYSWNAYEINLPSSPVPGSTGDIMMTPYIDMTGRDVVLVWDTKSGKSMFYNWSDNTYNWEPYEINITSNPVPGSTGLIMMEPYLDSGKRDVILAWDNTTGKSVFYRWNGSSYSWKAYEVNLPSSPISGATGEIRMHPYIDMTGRDVVLVWDMKSGKSLFYSWSDNTYNWEPYEINITSNPVPGSTGLIMMEPYLDSGKRDVVLATDMSSGESVFYRWNGSSYTWKAYEVNLPSNPVR